MRRPALLVTTSLVVVGSVLSAAAGQGTASTSYVTGQTITCSEGADCTVVNSSTADSSATSSHFARSSEAGKLEEAFGWAAARTLVRVPQGTKTVTATFTWDVSGSTVSASSTKGAAFAFTSLFAATGGCATGTGCTANADLVTVQSARSSDGAPAVLSGSSGAQTVVLTVTASGPSLPHWLAFYTYAESGAGGEESRICPPGLPCQVVSSTHAGTADASITGKVRTVDVAFG